MSISLENAKETLNNFNLEVAAYTAKNKLSILPEYAKLQTKEVIGSLYRNDQKYFETLSVYKANYYGIKSFFVKQKSENSDRILMREIESIEKIIDEKIKFLDTLVSTAKQRVKFYETIIYLITNMSYGDY